jgi:hypothetical protein
MHYFSNLFDKELYNNVYLSCYFCWLLLADANRQIPIAHIQCLGTPDDGQWTCPKYVEFFIK